MTLSTRSRISLALSALALGLAGNLAHAQATPDMPPPPPGAHGPHDGKGSRPVPKEMTRAEFVKEAERRFDAMDANHDGKVDMAEFRAFHEKMRDEHGPRGERPQGPHEGGQPSVGK